MWFPESWSKKTFLKGGIYELRFNSVFQGELKVFSIPQSCSPGTHAALSFGIIMLSGMINSSNGFTKASGNVASFSFISLGLFSH